LESPALDPAALTGHRYGAARRSAPTAGGPFGYVYTAGAGLIDIAHVADLADMTRFVFDAISRGANRLELLEGTAVVNRIPAATADRVELAAAIAYVESWAHELTTWGQLDQDRSSFSPEDIPSNITGVEVGRRALLRGGPFDAAVDAVLGPLLRDELGARPKADTEAVFAKIEGKWFRFTTIWAQLLRRNFDGQTWPAGMPFDAPTTFPWLTPTRFTPYYSEFTYAIREPVSGEVGITLHTMDSVTQRIKTAWLASHPGTDRP
jgi:hypothetical protein